MPDGFKIADAYVEIHAEINRRKVERAAGEVGDSTGKTIGERAGRNVTTSITKEIDKTKTDVDKSGSKVGGWFGSSFTKIFSRKTISGLPMGLSNPYVFSAVTAAGVLLAPALGAGISAGLIGGAGVGAIAGGIALIADDARIKASARSIQNSLFDIDTTEVQAELDKWRERLKAARRTNNEEMIKEAKQHIKALSGELAKAEAFNKKNTSLRDLAKPLIGPTLTALKMIGAEVNKLKPQIGTMFSGLAKSGAIESLTKGLIALVDKAMPGLMKLIAASGPFLADIGPSLGILGQGIGDFFSIIAAGGPDAAVFFKDLMAFLAGTIVQIGLVIYGLTKAYTAIRSFFTSIPGWVSSAKNAVTGWWDAMVNKGQAAVNWITGAGGKIGGFFTSVYNGAVSKGAAILNWFQALPGRVGNFLAALPGRVGNLIKATIDRALFLVGYGIGSIIKFWANLPSRTVSAISSLVSRVGTIMSNTASRARTLAGQLVTWVVQQAITLPGRTASAITGVIGRVGSILSSAASTARSRAVSLVTGFISYMGTLPGKAASAVSSTASRIGSALSGAASRARSIGADIIRGLISGINSMIGSAISAAKHAVGRIVSGAKSALGIGSPSKVMAKEVGRWLLPGVTTGVESTVPAAQRSVERALGSLVPDTPGTGFSGSTAGSAGGAMYYFAPGSIVLDVSKVRTLEDLVELIESIPAAARRLAASSGARMATA